MGFVKRIAAIWFWSWWLLCLTRIGIGCIWLCKSHAWNYVSSPPILPLILLPDDVLHVLGHLIHHLVHLLVGPSPFKSSPQCKNALYVIISALIPEHLIHIRGDLLKSIPFVTAWHWKIKMLILAAQANSLMIHLGRVPTTTKNLLGHLPDLSYLWKKFSRNKNVTL